MLSGLDGCFIENVGQTGDDSSQFYAIGEPLSVFLGIGGVTYRQEDPASHLVSLCTVRFNDANPIVPEGCSPLAHTTSFFHGPDQSDWVTGARSFREVVYRGLWSGIDIKYYFKDATLKYDINIEQGSDPRVVQFDYPDSAVLAIDTGTGDLTIQGGSMPLVDDAPSAYQSGPSGTYPLSCHFTIHQDDNIVGFDIPRFNPADDIIIDPGLEFGTVYGTSGEDRSYGMTVDDKGVIYLCGETDSVNVPLQGDSYCGTYAGGIYDGLIAAFDETTSQLLYATYIGGSGRDMPWMIRVMESGHICVVGTSWSTDFPLTEDAVDASMSGMYDGIFFVLNGTGSELLYSTYLGGNGWDQVQDLVLGVGGSLYLAGNTNSTDFPVTNGAYCTTAVGNDGFVAMFDSNLTMPFSTYIGGTESDWIGAIDLDSDAYPYIVGATSSADFPTSLNAFSRVKGGMQDGFVMRLSPQLDRMISSTFFGGSGTDSPCYVALDREDNIWLSGETESSNLPTSPGAYMEEYGGNWDAFLVCLDADLSAMSYSTYFGGSDAEWGGPIIVTPDGDPIALWTGESRDLQLPTCCYDPTHNGDNDLAVFWFDGGTGQLNNATYIGGLSSDLGYGISYSSSSGQILLAGTTRSSDFPLGTPGYDGTQNGNADCFIISLTMDRTPRDKPSVPLALRASGEDTAVHLAWNPPSDDGCWPILGYRIYMGTSAGNETFYKEVPVSLSCTVFNLVNGQRYYFRLAATSLVGEGALTPSTGVTPYTIPSPPFNLTLMPGDQNMSLTWERPMDSGGPPLLGYMIFRGVAEDATDLLTSVDNVTAYLDGEVVNGNRYYYKVKAFHEWANGTFSSTQSAVPYGRPGAPQSFSAKALSKQVKLSWLPPSSDGGRPLKGYKVFRGIGDGDVALHVALEPVAEYLDIHLSNGLRYRYSICAFNDAGDGPRTTTIDLTPYGLPDPPEDLSIEVGDGCLTLTWLAPVDTGGSRIIGYTVHRGTSPESLPVVVSIGNVTDFKDTGLTNGVVYFYRVHSRTQVGTSLPNDPVSGMPVGPPTEPLGFAVEGQLGEVVLSWFPPEDDGGSPVVRYVIHRGATKDAMGPLTEAGPTETRFIDRQVDNGKVYYYRVFAVNDRLEGPSSDILEAIPFGYPSSPLGLKAELLNGAVRLTWSLPESDGGRPIVDYIIYKGSSSSSMMRLANIGPVKVFVDRSVRYGEAVFYSVSAVNLAGEGEAADNVGITPMVPVYPPGVPVLLSGMCEDGRVLLRWEPPTSDGGSPLTGYIIKRGDSTDGLVLLVELGVVLSYIDGGVTPGMTYFYSVAARNSVGTGNSTRPISVEVVVSEGLLLPNIPLFILGLMLAIILAIGLAIVVMEPWRYALVMLMLPFLSKLAKDKLLEHRVRYAIQGIIIEKPGIHYSAIIEELGLTNGVAAYHLEVLEREHFIRSMNDGRFKRFFSVDAKVPADFRMSPEQIKERLISLVRQTPGIAQKEMIEELGIDRETVGYHLRELVKDERLSASKDGKYTTYHVRGQSAQ